MSNTTNLNLFKHDNPEQNTNPFDVEKALNKNWDKIDTYAGNINTDLAEKGTDITNIKAEQITQNTNIQTNANNITLLQSRMGTNETDISNIKTEQTQQNNRIGALEGDNTTNKSNIQTNTNNISSLTSRVGTNETNIATLQTDSGHSILLELNTTTYVLTATLKNKAGTTLNTSSIDLPVEQLVVSVTYDSSTKELVITLKSGQVTRVPLGDLISGLQTEITSSNKLSSDLVDDTNNTHKFVSTGEKQGWDAKYNKPNAGIPKTDLSNEVQTSLGKADTAIQQHQDISGKEDKSNKVILIDDTNTDIQYPSAKSVYDSQQNQNEKIEKLEVENARLKATLPTTTGTGENITLEKTAEMEFVKTPLPRGNTSQNTTQGVQLLDKDTVTVINGYIVSNLDTIGDNGASNKILYITIQPNTTYTVSKNNFSLDAFGIASTVNIPAKDVPITQKAVNKSANSLTITTGANDNYLAVYCKRADIIFPEIFYNIYLQIEEGSTASPYEVFTNGQVSPAPSYPQNINVVSGAVRVRFTNKNILKFDFIESPSKLAGLDYSFTDNTLTLNGTSTATGQNFTFKNNIFFQYGKTYCFSAKVTGTNPNMQLKLIAYNSSNQALTHIAINKSNNYKNILPFYIKDKIEYWILSIVINNNAVYDLSAEVMLEIGTTQTDPIQPKIQTLPLDLPTGMELCKMGDYRDYFYKDNGKWYLHKEIYKYFFTGQEDFVRVANTGNPFPYFRLYLSQPLGKASTATTILSNRYKGGTDTQLVQNVFKTISMSGNANNQLNITDDYATANDFKAFLQNNLTYVYYVLVQPTNTEITNTTLINQLEAIYNAISYEGQTNISGISGGENPLFDVEAYQNTKLILENLDDRLSLIEG